MMSILRPLGWLAAMALMVAGSADAHTFGARGAGFWEGLAHPFLGPDHLLAMVSVGIWSIQTGGRRGCWRLPLAFVSVMALGAWLGHYGSPDSLLEPMIALSVIVLGALVCMALRLPVLPAMGLICTFALFHGYAHGQEIPEAASPVAYAAGFVLATLCLHGIGLGLGLLASRSMLVTRLGGAAIAAAGVHLFPGL